MARNKMSGKKRSTNSARAFTSGGIAVSILLVSLILTMHHVDPSFDGVQVPESITGNAITIGGIEIELPRVRVPRPCFSFSPCSAGETECVAGGLRTCVDMVCPDYDWSLPTPCPSNTVCDGGRCVTPVPAPTSPSSPTPATPLCPDEPVSYPTTTWDRSWCSPTADLNDLEMLYVEDPNQDVEQFQDNWGAAAVGGLIPGEIGFRSGRSIYFEAGTYGFTVGADDRVRVWIDGNLVLDQWRDMYGYHEHNFDYTFGVSTHYPIRIDYLEIDGDAAVNFKYAKLQAKEEEIAIVPASRDKILASTDLIDVDTLSIARASQTCASDEECAKAGLPGSCIKGSCMAVKEREVGPCVDYDGGVELKVASRAYSEKSLQPEKIDCCQSKIASASYTEGEIVYSASKKTCVPSTNGRFLYEAVCDEEQSIGASAWKIYQCNCIAGVCVTDAEGEKRARTDSTRDIPLATPQDPAPTASTDAAPPAAPEPSSTIQTSEAPQAPAATVASCSTDAQCAPQGKVCSAGACVQCATSDHCGGRQCNSATNLCVDCVVETDCPTGQGCDETTNECICTQSEQCGQGKFCSNSRCTACPLESCTSMSARRCVAGGEQRCRRQANGCTSWVLHKNCDDDEECDSEYGCAKLCDDKCSNDGTSYTRRCPGRRPDSDVQCTAGTVCKEVEGISGTVASCVPCPDPWSCTTSRGRLIVHESSANLNFIAETGSGKIRPAVHRKLSNQLHDVDSSKNDKDTPIVVTDAQEKRIMKFTALFSQGDVDISSLQAIKNGNRYLLEGLDKIQGVRDIAIYVEADSRRGLFICPHAKSQDEIRPTCDDAVKFTHLQAVDGSTIRSITIAYDGKHYILTGAGILS